MIPFELHLGDDEHVVNKSGEEKTPFQLLTERLDKLESTIQTFEQTNITPIRDTIEHLNVEKDDLYNNYLKKKAELDSIQGEKRTELYRKMDELSGLKLEFSALNLEKAQLIQQEQAKQKIEKLEKKLAEIIHSFPTWSNMYEYQQEDVTFLCAAFDSGLKGVMNANPMGLGKTLESSAFDYIACHLFEQKFNRKPRVLWLTKKSLVRSSLKEILRWNPDRIVIPVEGTPQQREFMVKLAIQNNALCITNYDAIINTPMLRNTEWDIIYMDEVHKLKGGANPAGPTAVWQAVKVLTEKATFLVPLTGTPIQNRPQEVWAYLHLFDPIKFPSLRKFEREFTFGWPETKVNFEHLVSVLKNQIIRRKLEDVDIQLPDATRVFIPVDLTGRQKEIYDQMRRNFFIWLDEEQSKPMTATVIIAQLTRLRQIASFPGSIKIKDSETEQELVLSCNESAKIDEAMEIMEELFSQDEQVVVFSSQFNAPLDEVARRIYALGKSYRIVTGETSSRMAEYENDFQQKKFDALLINMKTGSEGLNLQKSDQWPGGASHAIFLDLWYNPATNEQAEARIHRIGQKAPCFFHIIQAVDSVDNFIAALLEEKSEMAEAIVDSDDIRKTGKEWKSYLADLI